MKAHVAESLACLWIPSSGICPPHFSPPLSFAVFFNSLFPLDSFSAFHTSSRLIENKPVKTTCNLCFFLAFSAKTPDYLLSIPIHRHPSISWSRHCDRICHFLIRRTVRKPLFLAPPVCWEIVGSPLLVLAPYPLNNKI